MSRRCGRGSSTGRLAHPRIQCGWLWRALKPRRAGQPLSGLTVRRILPKYTVRPPVPHPRRAVCCINWIRRHDTFPSCLLRCKLHSPFSYVAGDAACYAWRRFDKTTPGMLNGGFKERARKSRSEIPFACIAIMYEQYVILCYIIGPTCRGPSSHVRASLKIEKGGARCTGRGLENTLRHKLSRTLSRQGNTTHSGRRVLRSGGPNHSKPAVFIVFFSKIELVAS